MTIKDQIIKSTRDIGFIDQCYNLTLETNFYDDLFFDESIMQALLEELEDIFDIDLNNEEIYKINDLVKAVERLI